MDRAQQPSDEQARTAPGTGRNRPALITTTAAAKRLAVLLVSLAAITALAINHATNMPGRSHTGPIDNPTPETEALADQLRAHVEVLATHHTGRSTFNPLAYAAAAGYLKDQLTRMGLVPEDEPFETNRDASACLNIYADLAGATRPDEIIVIGAHYDALMDEPGADDNASGTAATLELARALTNAQADRPLDRTVRFALFANEEPPYFGTDDMGSHRHALAATQRGETVTAMLSLEMLGYYDDTPGSQHYPPPFDLLYPDRGNFVAFISNLASSSLTRRTIRTFRENARFPSAGAVLPASIEGVDYSDQRSFWLHGIPAVMITDTAHNRNPNYHTPHDTPDTLDYHRMALVTQGLEHVVVDLATFEGSGAENPSR
ncbi:MAG: M28 family peptidase [Planctomycetota bacterium]